MRRHRLIRRRLFLPRIPIFWRKLLMIIKPRQHPRIRIMVTIDRHSYRRPLITLPLRTPPILPLRIKARHTFLHRRRRRRIQPLHGKNTLTRLDNNRLRCAYAITRNAQFVVPVKGHSICRGDPILGTQAKKNARPRIRLITRRTRLNSNRRTIQTTGNRLIIPAAN